MATIFGDNAGNILAGTNDGDLISGLDGDDDLAGLGGDDTLDGGLGDDTMSGAVGNDSYIVDSAGDIVIEGSGKDIDTVVSSVTYTLGANLENLTLSALALAIDGTGNALNNVIIGNDFDNRLVGLAGNDTISAGAGRDTVDGGLGADSMAGGEDDDIYVVDNLMDVVTEAMNEGVDTVRSLVSFTLGDNVENLVITASGAANGTGNALDNAITGGKGVNALSGLDGNDSLDGGAGADKMTGGAGDDAYTVDNVKDAVIEAAMAGIDTVTSSVTFTLGMNVENLILTGAAATNGTGNDLDNAIAGNAGNNSLAGLDGSDSLGGGGGNDMLDGGSGDDTQDGGAGDDTYMIDAEGDDVLLEDAGKGTDTVLSAAATFSLLANFENLTLIGDAVDGSGNDVDNVITGNANGNSLDGLGGNDTIRGLGGDDVILGGDGSDSLDGGDGDDVLDGEAGADTMAGFAGNDIYFVDDAFDVVLEGAGKGGIDEVISQVSYTLGANVENLTLVGSGTVIGAGNALANTIVSDSDSLLLGLAGNDTVMGSSGNDTINGGAGIDSMAGGAGDDGYTVDNAKDVVSEALMEGIDTVTSSVNFILGMNVENLILTGMSALNGTGNEIDNAITGNAGSNKIDGGAGSDTLRGGLGNDSYTVDDQFGDIVLEDDGEGTDTVFSAAAEFALLANLENLTLIGAAMVGSGNGLDNIITGNDKDNSLDGLSGNDTVRAMGGDDNVFGSDGNDGLDGGLGDDFLDGGTGTDTMNGGAGNDTFFIDDAGDVIVEAANGGLDEASSVVSYTLGNGVENLTLFGVGLTGTGNALANMIVGNGDSLLLQGLAGNDVLVGSGNDTLNGGLGADTMMGGAGDNTYIVDSAMDAVVENPDEGTDTVRSSISYTLADEVENLTLSGRGHLNGTGNALDNVIAGNTGNNQLSGLDGNDALLGGAGNDNLTGGAGMDTLTGGQGTDTLAGGADSDRFDVNSLDGSVDNVTDFSSLAPGMGGDILDLADLLIGFDPMQSAIDDFVQYMQQGNDTRVLVNADGMGADFVAVAVLQGVAGVTAGQALANGNLDVTPDM